MRKPDPRAIIRSALILPVLVLLVTVACRNSGTGSMAGTDTAGKTIATDSLTPGMLDSLIRKDPKNPELFAKRAALLAEKKSYSQALNDITIALKLDSTKPGYYISQAEYYIFSGEPNSAKKGLNTCLRIFPDNPDVLLKMAEIHLYLKEYGQAKMVLQQVMPINDDIAQIYFIQGVVALETGDTVGALRNFQVTIDKEPEYYAAYIQAGKIYASQHDDLAIQYLKSAIDLQPGMYEAHYLLGFFYQEHNLLDEAMQEYDFISTQIDSTLPDPYFNRGYIEMVYRANYGEAAEWFSKAIKWNPGHADSWYNRGFSYELDGQLSKARADYEKAMELQPNYPLAIKGINRIADGKPLKRK